MARDVTIKHLRAFLTVAQFQSFTRAAEKFHSSQPVLTMTVRQLEDIVGTSLFDRTTRSVNLTPQGRDFLPVAERLLYDFDAAIEDVQATAKSRRLRIGIAAVQSVATKLLPHVIRDFCGAHPDIRFHLRDGNSSDVRRRVRRNEVDIGFGSMTDHEPELEFVPLFRDQLGLIARADHPLFQTNRPLIWKDLDQFDFIGLAADTATKPILEAIADLPHSVVSPQFEVSNNTTLWAMLEVGYGITTTPALSALGSEQDRLIFRPLSKPVMWRTVHTIVKRGRSLSEVSNELLAAVRTRLIKFAQESDLIEAS